MAVFIFDKKLDENTIYNMVHDIHKCGVRGGEISSPLHNTYVLMYHIIYSFDVITSIVSFLWAYTTVARDVTGERVRTAYDVTAACYHKRRTQRNVFCHKWY
jgi:hypothetical protein